MTKTDPRVIKTLRQIDASLLENIAHNDFKKISIDMLCDTALINRSTFYKYYTDKYDLLDNYLDRTIEEFKEAFNSTDFILATPYTVNDAKYKENFKRSIQFIYQHRDTYRILWNARIERNLYREMVLVIQDNIIRKLQENIQVPEDAIPYQELYSHLFASNLMALVNWWLANEDTITSADVERLMNSNMKNGMFTTFKYCI